MVSFLTFCFSSVSGGKRCGLQFLDCLGDLIHACLEILNLIAVCFATFQLRNFGLISFARIQFSKFGSIRLSVQGQRMSLPSQLSQHQGEV